jgi:hypothetical protein
MHHGLSLLRLLDLNILHISNFSLRTLKINPKTMLKTLVNFSGMFTVHFRKIKNNILNIRKY